MKKFLFIILSCLSIVILITGCGEDTSTGEGKQEESQETIILDQTKITEKKVYLQLFFLQ